MFKTVALTLSLFVVGCSSANFDIAEPLAECADCIDSTSLNDGAIVTVDGEVSDSSVSNPDSSLDESSLPDTYVTDSNVPDTLVVDTSVTDTFVPDTYKPDTYVADTYIPDTYTPPKDTAPSCTPKTCTSIYLATGNQACGTQSDGCGGYVTCPACTDITKACGGSPGFDHIWSPSTGSLGSPLPPVPYQCVGTCESLGSTPSFCSNTHGWTSFMRCSNPILSPLTKCVGSSYAAFAGDKSAWCCESPVIQ